MRIGIYGGMFSPIHNGHVMAAKAFMEQMWLDLLYIVPTGSSPQKQMDHGADNWQRLRMCELAFEGVDGVVISDMEVRREGNSYTVDTLRALSDPQNRLFLLMGTDQFLSLDGWRDTQEIFDLCYPVYIRREGNDPIIDARIVSKISEYQQKYGKVVRRVTGEPLPISSTMVRNAIRSGKDFSGMVPQKVKEYILDHKLYV